MKSCITYAQLKASAKERMKPVLGTLIGAAAISIGIHLVIRLSVSRPHPFFIRSPFLWYMMSYLILILSNTLLGMLQTGFCHLALKAHRGQAVSVSDLFYAFSRQTKSSIVCSVFMSLITVVPTIPFHIASRSFAPENSVPHALALFSGVPGMILSIVLQLTYSQAYYLLLEYPALPANQLLKNSRLMMCGHKKQYLFIQVRLYLSALFITLLTCFIGGLWTTPFIFMVKTKFYLELAEHQLSEQETSAPS